MNLFRIPLALIAAILAIAHVAAAPATLAECRDAARANYPLIKNFGLLDSSLRLELSAINRGWLPVGSLHAQATAQNVVPGFPDILSDVLTHMGADIPGLDRFQYKIGVDVSQTIWDGGQSSAGRSVARASVAERQAALEAQLYAVSERVDELFFAVLLLDEQIRQTEITASVLEAGLADMRSMLRHGAASQSDVDIFEARLLGVAQQLAAARSSRASSLRVLEIFTSLDLSDGLAMPEPEMPCTLVPERPELKLYDARRSLCAAREAAVGSTLMPRIAFFAQAFYGYPGYDYFKSMMTRDLTFNAMAGIKISWNFSALYNSGADRRRQRLAAETVESDRSLFLLNLSMQAASRNGRISELRALMADDERIIALLESARKAAESSLRNGVIDSTTLLSRIADENTARINASYHQIQLLQSICQLKHILNQ